MVAVLGSARRSACSWYELYWNTLPKCISTAPLRIYFSVFAVLASAKGDKDALKTKLYSHIMLGRNDDALQLIQTHKSIAADVVFEKAYCLFRTGRLDAALELLQGSEGEGSQHLTAIIHMRQKHSQAASALYSSLAPKVKGNKQGSIELVRSTCIDR